MRFTLPPASKSELIYYDPVARRFTFTLKAADVANSAVVISFTLEVYIGGQTWQHAMTLRTKICIEANVAITSADDLEKDYILGTTSVLNTVTPLPTFHTADTECDVITLEVTHSWSDSLPHPSTLTLVGKTSVDFSTTDTSTCGKTVTIEVKAKGYGKEHTWRLTRMVKQTYGSVADPCDATALCATQTETVTPWVPYVYTCAESCFTTPSCQVWSYGFAAFICKLKSNINCSASTDIDFKSGV